MFLKLLGCKILLLVCKHSDCICQVGNRKYANGCLGLQLLIGMHRHGNCLISLGKQLHMHFMNCISQLHGNQSLELSNLGTVSDCSVIYAILSHTFKILVLCYLNLISFILRKFPAVLLNMKEQYKAMMIISSMLFLSYKSVICDYKIAYAIPEAKTLWWSFVQTIRVKSMSCIAQDGSRRT